jgi:hypothetical protein
LRNIVVFSRQPETDESSERKLWLFSKSFFDILTLSRKQRKGERVEPNGEPSTRNFGKRFIINDCETKELDKERQVNWRLQQENLQTDREELKSIKLK